MHLHPEVPSIYSLFYTDLFAFMSHVAFCIQCYFFHIMESTLLITINYFIF